MTDMRRTILWVVFSASLVLLWDAWNKHNGHPSMFSPSATKPAAVGAAPGASGVPAATVTAGSSAATPSAGASAPLAGEKVLITTDVMKATFDSIGGQLIRLELLKHRDADDPKQHVMLFDRNGTRDYVAQSGLITQQAGVQLPTHLTPMAVQAGERDLKDGTDKLTLSFESAEVGGVRLIKTYTFTRGQYTIDVTHEVRNGGSKPVAPELYLQLARDGHVPSGSMFMAPTAFTGPAYYTEASKFHKLEFKDIEKTVAERAKKGENNTIEKSDNGWIGMVQHYFNSAWLVKDGSKREIRTDKVSDNLYSIAMVLPLAEVPPDGKLVHQATLFAGPQEEKKLETLAPGLDRVKDYGIFYIIAQPLFWLLNSLHGLIGNWGWAIVALVVLLKIAFYWLNASAYRSMAKMKAINPRVMELRERYKDKPQQMQQEMMRIYREEKVNPIGGCLPIFVQMPFFIALYWVLLSSVEMRHAPWIGWITDLSAKDPYFILPLLMTASSLLQTWLNPTPPDPVQAKMMWIMPLAFSVMFFVFPAGLVLYWLTNNILSIAQQWLIYKQLGVLGK